MKEFYYQIKGKTGESGWGKWSFPPIFSGMVMVEDKKEAKEIVEKEYNKKFPLRVLNKDLDSNEFLLKIEEFTDYHKRLFEIRNCKKCDIKFRIIDHYNNQNERYNSEDHCSDKCHLKYLEEQRLINSESYIGWNDSPPVIYKITNKNNNKCYVGQTIRSFTLRWWEHLKWGSTDCKFQKALKEFDITNWIFEVIEVLKSGDELNEKESYYINKFNSIENGYNSVKVKVEGSHSS